MSKDLPCFSLNFNRRADNWSLLHRKLSSWKASTFKKLVTHCSGEALGNLGAFSWLLRVFTIYS